MTVLLMMRDLDLQNHIPILKRLAVNICPMLFLANQITGETERRTTELREIERGIVVFLDLALQVRVIVQGAVAQIQNKCMRSIYPRPLFSYQC